MSFPQTIRRFGLALAMSCCASIGTFYRQSAARFSHQMLLRSPRQPRPGHRSRLQTIQTDQIEKTIQTLVSFGTRSTLSSMEKDLPAGQGVSAAADWVAGQFEQISKECGGCLEVHRDTFTSCCRSHPATHNHHQHLRICAYRSGPGQTHGAGHRTLRLAQHKCFGCTRRRTGSKR